MTAAVRRIVATDWFIALVFLGIYFCTNKYTYAWDDQHLEIPLLKHLIDPSLYKGDYYVEGLSKHFSSYLYPLLAKFIKVDQVRVAYLVLFVIARYAMFFWVYKLWLWISKDRTAAFIAVLMFIVLGRTEEFLYRTFSHQEFSFIFMFAGIYAFYRERFLLAATLFGLGTNFNAIYNILPMAHMGFFLLLRKDRWGALLKACGIFLLAALPFLYWQIPGALADKIGGKVIPISEWMPLYLLSCPQNFLFQQTPFKEVMANPGLLFSKLNPDIFLLGLYAMLCLNPLFRRDGKVHAICGAALLMMVFSFIFTYIHPSRFVIDLNLVRNDQFVRFMLMGYATIILYGYALKAKPWQAFLAGLALFAIGLYGTDFLVERIKRFYPAYIAMVLVWLWLVLKPEARISSFLRKCLILIPLLASFTSFAVYHYQYVYHQAKGTGFFQFYRAWVDMQNFVRTHTPKDAMIFTPYNTDTGGFRIFSERKVLVCYRDCGIIGFDYAAALEWHKRVKDVEEYKMMTQENFEHALANALFKYRVNYVVFMNYYAPAEDNAMLKKRYQNEVLSLFEVTR